MTRPFAACVLNQHKIQRTGSPRLSLVALLMAVEGGQGVKEEKDVCVTDV